MVERVTAAIAKRETPGPIPNPEVKPFSADGTAIERLWESRTPPDKHLGRGHQIPGGPACISRHSVSTVAPGTGPEALRREVRLWPRTVEDSVRREVDPVPDEAAPPAAVAVSSRGGRRPPRRCAESATRRGDARGGLAAATRRPARQGRRPPVAATRAATSAGSAPTSAPSAAGPRRSPARLDQAAYDGPDLPEEITGAELDRGVRAQLKGLPEKLAARVARHLAAAGVLIDEDPETAYQHTLAARARASRLAVVREAAGEAAYAAGHYAEALVRAARREADERGHRLPADHGRLPPRARQPRAGDQAGQEPLRRQLQPPRRRRR